MIVFPNAKINLGLNVVAKRSDGYHDISSGFLPVSLCDALEILPSKGGDNWHFSGLPIPGRVEDNLCQKAIGLLRKDFEVPPLDIYLHKAIPMGGGMGGGSSDAVSMLKATDKQFGLNLSTDALYQYALKLGSDCPFFVENKPALVSGRGETLGTLAVDLSDVQVVIAFPPVHVSTAAAFAGMVPRKPEVAVAQIIQQQPRASWKTDLKNDFETTVFANHPELKTLKETFYEMGALYASMTGSGAAVYGLFEKNPSPVLLKDLDVDFWKGRFL